MRCPFCRNGTVDAETLGGRMAVFRAQRLMGVRAAAGLAGVGFSTWARIERGYAPSTSSRARLEKLLRRHRL